MPPPMPVEEAIDVGHSAGKEGRSLFTKTLNDDIHFARHKFGLRDVGLGCRSFGPVASPDGDSHRTRRTDCKELALTTSFHQLTGSIAT